MAFGPFSYKVFSSSEANLSSLVISPKQQWIIAIILIGVLGGGTIIFGSIIPIIALIAIAIMSVVVINPFLSLLGVLVVNVFLAVRSPVAAVTGAPSAIELIIGVLLSLIIGYWLIQLRILQWKSLSTSVGQLLIVFFVAWSIMATIIGLSQNPTSFQYSLRELLNVMPLLFLPILYERYIPAYSSKEKLLWKIIVLCGIAIIVASILQIRSHLIQAVYLYEAGHSTADVVFCSFWVLFVVSIMTTTQKLRTLLISYGALAFGFIGILISMKRSLYISTVICTFIVVLLGSKEERRRGVFRLGMAIVAIVLIFMPVYFSSRLTRLMLAAYVHRFLTSQHITSDLSLLNRYVEYGYAWKAVLHSPVFGYGFGGRFRTFEIIDRVHKWVGFTHNSYLYIAVKAGIIASVLFIAAYFSFIIKGFKLLRSKGTSVMDKMILRACLASLILFLFFASTEPAFDSKTELGWIALMWGYFLALEQQKKTNKTSEFSLSGS